NRMLLWNSAIRKGFGDKQGEYMQLDINPGVPLRSAPGYVLVAPLGRIHPKHIHPKRVHTIFVG
ncbi:hypothetical protein, partial [Xylanibacter rodentium]|uniref:hypothetical protein n=1 Tax=Xylanibacter rodentium TaxID=2736289 RepID=UPI00255824BE